MNNADECDVDVRVVGRAGRITLNRPNALNALNGDMAVTIEVALDRWSSGNDVDLVVIDAVQDRAFCAGGDIAELYERGLAGDFGFGRDFWRQEYRLNLMIAEYPKPVVAFMQGFTMGGGVGLGCHASHRVVCENTQIAMPECGIGLVPDVGGSMLLGKAPGQSGVYLGLTGSRMNASDAIYAGFADHFVPQEQWSAIKDALIEEGCTKSIVNAALVPTSGSLAANQKAIDRLFAAQTVARITRALESDGSDFAQSALRRLSKGAPLSLAAALRMIRSAADADIETALRREYRFVYRSQERGDFNEGIRAQIIDKDQNPAWRHKNNDVPEADIRAMLAPLGPAEWNRT
jgi:enoyl-CoA hydratase/carnithine racemase